MSNRNRSRCFISHSIAVLAALVCIHNGVRAQLGTFDSTSDGSDGPLVIPGALAPIQDFSSVYDSARNELVVFGGQQYSPNPTIEIDHTYTFDGTSWNRKRTDVHPPASEHNILAYNSDLQQVVLYNNDGDNNFCWIWDGADWTEIDPPDPDQSFDQAAMAYDTEREEIIMVAKRQFSSSALETWGFDGTSWTQKTPATIPPSHFRVSIVYDQALQLMVMILRENASTFDTWTWNGTDWAEISTSPADIDDTEGIFLYDGRTSKTTYLGEDRAYTFSGTNWESLENVPTLFSSGFGFGNGTMVFHAGLNAIVRLNGSLPGDDGFERKRNETWAWYADGSVERLSKGTYDFNTNEKPDGTWNFTGILVGPNTIVNFPSNDGNTPIRWLASGNATIEGVLNLSASVRQEDDLEPQPKGLGGYPGSGGYKGATGGPDGVNLRVFGDGPGGGIYTGTSKSNDGEFDDYGNPWLYPLIGGSGAGNVNDNQGGGGGGGAILIASSTEIVLYGSILAEGKTQSNSVTGTGSGGAVLLRANTLRTPGGIIRADRIRLDGWIREIDELSYFMANAFQNFNQGLPLLPVVASANPPKLWIDSIDGNSISLPTLSSDSQNALDADFSSGGPVAIVVKGENIPETAQIYLRISLEDGSILEPDPVFLTLGQATFVLELPDGYGAISATARFMADTAP